MAEPPKGRRGSINFCQWKICRETDPPPEGREAERRKRKVKRIRIGNDSVGGSGRSKRPSCGKGKPNGVRKGIRIPVYS